MSLSELLKALAESRRLEAGNPLISRVVSDSRDVRPGDLFVAVPGVRADGHAFLGQAAERGAAAVVVERAEAAPNGVPGVLVPDAREAVARLAHRIHGDPTQKLTVCGITGTNGKTTTTYLLRSILEADGRRVGLLGTISYQLGDREVPALTTTPGAVELAGYFADLVRRSYDAAVMEVSSHALDQRRTDGVRFRAAAFTNLTREHLDYHENMPSYRRAKGRLFAGLAADAVAVLNRDEPASKSFAKAAAAGRIIWYSMKRDADVRAEAVELSTAGSRFRMRLGDEQAEIATPLLGKHNVYNCMTAAAVAVGLGVPTAHIVAGLESVAVVPGRLQPVRCGQPFAVLVDYAHTDDALENSLKGARPLVRGKLIAVFGCGGDRDRKKRPRMARVAESLADVVIVTNDNPRTEDPEAIADEVFKGFRSPDRAIRELDRAAAITHAVRMAAPGDVVVIAGKGHEAYQIIGDRKHEFDDCRKAREALARLGHVGCEEVGGCG